ncbi:MAG: hypothetical protein H6737_29035 [Alphaproteobacteria bacterium]|nr:hypothetical protein [Alphaproteobacteria bacterium]
MRAWLIAITVAAGCGTPWIEEIDGDYRRLTTTLDSNKSGQLKASIRPEVGESAMLVTAEPLDDALDCHVRSLQVASDFPFRADQEVASDKARTNAAFIGHTVSLNWPITEDDGFLRPNTSHKVQIGVVDSSLAYTGGDTRVSVVLKRDIDFSGGVLRVNIVFAGSTGADDEIVVATEEAVALWRNIYDNIGIELDITYFDYTAQGIVGAPGQSDLLVYEDISRSVPFGAVNLVVVEEIDGFDQVFGFAGDIPGPMVSSGRSAVAVSAGLHAGADGRFSAAEVQLLGETIAHETGHFIGLFHPVELTFDSWDALDDTPDCTGDFACRESLGANLMYPTPICDGVSCVPQVGLTPQQGAVANRYTGVL